MCIRDRHKTGAQVHVIMTGSATKLVAPQTFETLSGNRVSVETFDRNVEWNVMHVSLAKKDVYKRQIHILARRMCEAPLRFSGAGLFAREGN